MTQEKKSPEQEVQLRGVLPLYADWIEHGYKDYKDKLLEIIIRNDREIESLDILFKDLYLEIRIIEDNLSTYNRIDDKQFLSKCNKLIQYIDKTIDMLNDKEISDYFNFNAIASGLKETALSYDITNWMTGKESVGKKNIETVTHTLMDCRRWAEEARPEKKKRGVGRPRNIVGEAAVARLVKLWEQQTGQRPVLTTDRVTNEKSGDFLEFCEAVMAPIWESAGQSLPSLPDLVKRCLYE